MFAKNRGAPGRQGERDTLRAIASAMAGVGLAMVVVLGVQWVLLLLTEEPAGSVAIRSPGGSLIICGGGRLPEEIRDTFVELAGGREGRIVVIPTANRSADAPGAERALAPWRARGVASVVRLHTRSRTQADDPVFCRPLSEATGVWINGGRQLALASIYGGTEVERQLKALLDRGGVIGGTSAGAAVMTRVMIASGRTEAIVSHGFDLLPGAVIDQHFLRRNRARRLLGVVESHRDLIGFGIDEGTSLVISPRTGRLRVLGASYVLACIPGGATGAARYEILKPGDEADIGGLRRPHGVIASAIDFDSLESD